MALLPSNHFAKLRDCMYIEGVKKINLQASSFLKPLVALVLIGLYWYWINQKIISESNQAFGLTGFFLLMSTATAYFPLPANLLVLGAVNEYAPALIAFVAGLGTLVAYVSEYFFFTALFKLKKVAHFKETWIYRKVAPLFNAQKFFVLTFASFLPIPSEPLRIYAITTKYSKLRFLSAGFVGRVPRYFLLGYYGKDYVQSVWFLAAVMIFPVVFLLAIRGGYVAVNFVRNRIYGGGEAPSISVQATPGSASSAFPESDFGAGS